MTLIIIALAGVLALASFVAWLYHHEAVKAERRLSIGLTPGQRARLEAEEASLQQQVANARKEMEYSRAAIVEAESEAAQVAADLNEWHRRQREGASIRAEFFEFLRKLDLEPGDVGIHGI